MWISELYKTKLRIDYYILGKLRDEIGENSNKDFERKETW